MGYPASRNGALIAVLSLVAAAACQDAPDSALPTEVAAARVGARAGCDAGTIQNRINRLYPVGPARASAHAQFNEARRDDRAGRGSEADLGFIGLAAETIGRLARGELQPSSSPLDPLVDDLVERLYACAGIPVPDLDGLLPPDLSPIRDIAVGAGVPGESFEVVTPSGNASVSGGTDFLDAAALILVYRLPDDDQFSDGTFQEYPPRYHVTVEPYDAQANYDAGAPTGPSSSEPLATVSVCPGDPHPHPLTQLSVLRRPEPFLDEGVALLPFAPSVAVACVELPPFAAATLPGADHSLGGRLAALWSRVVNGAGGLLTSAFSPAPLYAVDGGIGGRTRLLSDFVAARPVSTSE
ncbi:MAG TPA: hypothetical protein VGE02_08190 [Gemmatimonadales bacterium]